MLYCRVSSQDFWKAFSAYELLVLTAVCIESMVFIRFCTCMTYCTFISFQVRKADFNNDQYVQDFGISINDKMVELEGRVLQAPKLQYGGKVSKLFFLIILNKLWWQIYIPSFYSVVLFNILICSCQFNILRITRSKFGSSMKKGGAEVGFGLGGGNLLSQRPCSCVIFFLSFFALIFSWLSMWYSHTNSSVVHILRIVHVLLIIGLCCILFIFRTK